MTFDRKIYDFFHAHADLVILIIIIGVQERENPFSLNIIQGEGVHDLFFKKYWFILIVDCIRKRVSRYKITVFHKELSYIFTRFVGAFMFLNGIIQIRAIIYKYISLSINN